ncbi:MAG: hypothetical protein HC942_24000 [Microcoleus sp. SU_5_6]|nr:hypothetical protein [Microcoleus sp. SU_5_6]
MLPILVSSSQLPPNLALPVRCLEAAIFAPVRDARRWRKSSPEVETPVS